MNKHIIRNTILKYSISFTILTGLLFLVISTRGIFSDDLDKVTVYRYLTDGFTLPGIIFILVGLLVLLTNQGSLTSITWALKRFFKALIPFANTKPGLSYQEYKDTRTPITGYSFLFISGFIYFGIGLIFLILFYSSYNAI